MVKVEECRNMRLSYNDVFKYSDLLNPISSNTIFLAGKLADLNPKKNILDLGSGKGYPSLLWASVFGANVEGFDLNKSFVEYANSRARLLNLSNKARYLCGDVRELKFIHKYDVVSSLGLGIVRVYGTIRVAIKKFKSMLRNGGFLILGEPVWLVKPVPQNVQETLKEPEQNLGTKHEIDYLLSELNFEVLKFYVSSKEDWECYIRPVNVVMLELMESNPKLSTECKEIIDDFEAEYQAAKRYLDMVLWVARTN